MTIPSNSFKQGKSFFHALGKTHLESNQYVFESAYKSAHNVKLSDIWSDDISYALTSTDADNFATNNSTICKKYTEYTLTEIPGSNKQAYYINDGGKFIRPFISPVDIPNNVTNDPSYGYEGKLYRNDNSLISPTSGVFVIDYYSGTVLFQVGYTPIDLGWGIPKLTCYAYIGNFGVSCTDNTIRKTGINENTLVTIDSFDKTSHIACVWDYVIKKDNDMRTGTIKSCWNSLDNIEFYEDSTNDLGDTSQVELSVVINNNDVNLNCFVNVGGNNGWEVIAIQKKII